VLLKASSMVTFAPSVTPAMPSAVMSIGKQNMPSPLCTEYGRINCCTPPDAVVLKSDCCDGFCFVERKAPTANRCPPVRHGKKAEGSD
jgi:hypothetical protein